MRVVALVDAARARGVDVTADMMSYPTGGAWWGPRAVFPESVYNWRKTVAATQVGEQDGPPATHLARLALHDLE